MGGSTDERPSLFLAGPFRSNRCGDYRSREIALWSKHGFRVADPISDVGDLRGEGLDPHVVRRVVEGDCALIDGCDAVVAYAFQSSSGTAMESLIGRLLGKPLVVVAGPADKASPWILYFADCIIEKVTADAAHAVRSLVLSARNSPRPPKVTLGDLLDADDRDGLSLALPGVLDDQASRNLRQRRPAYETPAAG